MSGRRRRWLLMATAGLLGSAVLAVAAVALLGGCGELGYYRQSVAGHWDVLSRARAVHDVRADSSTEPGLRERLALAQRMRRFAVEQLHLPDNASYTRFADLQRDAVVWNVVAAPPLSLTLKTWCFPVMGCVGYRGYYQRDEADQLAESLRREGLEVAVYGVPAYSTLGWSNWVGGDPLLNTFIRWPEGELARILFHELAHQVVYVNDDTMFNESFATAVERAGGQRWLQMHAGEAARAEYERLDARRRDFRALTLAHRERLSALYASPADESEKLKFKAVLREQLLREYEALKRERWGGFSGYDAWVLAANNASFGVQAAYDQLVPAFTCLLDREGGDMARFYGQVRHLADLPAAQRRAHLQALGDC
jgi:predicted aminopeptidase